MAASRRALGGTLLRAAAQSSLSTARPAAAALVAPKRASLAWRPVATPYTSTLRWYSANEDPEAASRRKYSFNDIQQQIKINDELAESGKEEAKDGKKKVVFVDVREPEELLLTGRIPGAINIPVTSAIQSFHISDEDFSDLYGFQRPPKDAELMMYCKAGVRARTAAGLAQHAGWKNVSEYPGSWLDWAKNNGPKEVKKEGAKWERTENQD